MGLREVIEASGQDWEGFCETNLPTILNAILEGDLSELVDISDGIDQGDIDDNPPAAGIPFLTQFADDMNNLKPVTWNSNQNNLDDPEFDTIPGWDVNLSGNRELRGVVAPSSPVARIICITDNNNRLRIRHEHNGANEANRFITPSQANYDLRRQETALIWYDGSASRWRIFGRRDLVGD